MGSRGDEGDRLMPTDTPLLLALHGELPDLIGSQGLVEVHHDRVHIIATRTAFAHSLLGGSELFITFGGGRTLHFSNFGVNFSNFRPPALCVGRLPQALFLFLFLFLGLLLLLRFFLFHLFTFALTMPIVLVALAVTAHASVTRDPGGFGVVMALGLGFLVVGRQDGTWKTHIQSAYT